MVKAGDKFLEMYYRTKIANDKLRYEAVVKQWRENYGFEAPYSSYISFKVRQGKMIKNKKLN